MPTFFPPIAYDNPAILPETRGLQYRLFRYYGPYPRGRSVVFRGGTYVTVDVPDQDEIDLLVQGETYFLGGHYYPITDAIAAALTTAGYGAYIT